MMTGKDKEKALGQAGEACVHINAGPIPLRFRRICVLHSGTTGGLELQVKEEGRTT